MTLKLHNSLTRRKEEFEPIQKSKVGIYVCGPTVYGHAHLGHAKSYVSFDVLVRYLRYLGYDVTYVQNITDVGHLLGDTNEGEDRILVAAEREKKHPMAIAEYYARNFFDDMDKLNCVRPDISPRATGHIVEQIELVKLLLAKGYAYEANGSVYFDVSKFKDYGKLSGRNTEEMLAGARVEVSPDKRNPVDFALWKKAEPDHIMQWPSPWGMGFPGWHVECSVMAMKYLGKTIDIHGGGLDNKFPHHECEIAQSEAANGVQFVRYWLHNNMVTVDGQKMSRSLNNFINLKQVFSGAHERLTRYYDPMAVRQLVLNSHYRSPLDFSDAALFAAQSGFEKISRTVIDVDRRINSAPSGQLDEQVAEQLKQLKEKFEAAMDDDLNTSIALSIIFELVRLANELIERADVSAETLKAVYDLLETLAGGVLGVTKEGSGQSDEGAYYKLCKTIEVLLEQRNEARNEKDFKRADTIRDKLNEIGVVIEDKSDQSIWRWR
jgi:cysteinyl-tRNA synthetase